MFALNEGVCKRELGGISAFGVRPIVDGVGGFLDGKKAGVIGVWLSG